MAMIKTITTTKKIQNVSINQNNDDNKGDHEEIKGNDDEKKIEEEKKPDNQDKDKDNNRDVVISNVEVIEKKQMKQIQKAQRDYERNYYYGLYTTYLYWTPLMGFIGVYYLYLGQYKQFFMRFFSLNFWLIGWIVDAYRIPQLVREKLKEDGQYVDDQKELLIQ